jgi:hypothetical protein
VRANERLWTSERQHALRRACQLKFVAALGICPRANLRTMSVRRFSDRRDGDARALTDTQLLVYQMTLTDFAISGH